MAARRAARLCAMLLTVLLAAGSASAWSQRLAWFDLTTVPGPVGADLRRQQGLSCGVPQLVDWPMHFPASARLVLMACHGGPYACPGRADDYDRFELQLGCPGAVSMRQLATALVLLEPAPGPVVERIAAELGGGFAVMPAADGDGDGTVLVERPGEGVVRDWSPRRLHLQVSATRGVFRAAGYGSQLRLRLSLEPPVGPAWVLPCDPTVIIRGGSAGQKSSVERILRRDDPRCRP